MTKKKKIEFLICLLIIWGAAALEGYAFFQQKEEDRLLETFDVLESSPVEGCLEFSVPLNKLYLNQKEKQNVLEEMAADLGLGEGYEIQEEKRENSESVILKKEGDIGSVHLSITTMNMDMGDGRQRQNQYIYVLYRSVKKMDTMLAYKEKIEQVLRNRGLDPVPNLNFTGQRKGKLSLEQQDQLTDRLFHYLKAKEVDSVKEKELYTVYGYSGLLKDSVAYGDNEINLNLAFSYEEEKDVTIFYLAMPYLRTDY